MKIVHVVCEAPPEIGGMGQAALREVEGLRARGHEAILIAPKINEVDVNQAIHRLSTRFRFGNASILKDLLPALKGADLVHLHYPNYGVTEVLWRYRKQLPPIVMTFHMDATADGWKGSIFNVHRRFLQSRLFDMAKAIFVSSKDYAEHASIRTWMKKHADRVHELPFGIDTEVYKPDPANKRKNSILFVGGLDTAHIFKGLSELLQAMIKLSPDTKLRIVGDGDLRADFERQTKDLGLTERVTFLGRLPTEPLRREYREASLLAFPSTSPAEAFGLVALEAQASGTPVVASTWPGVRTLVKDGETGLLVPPKDVEALANALRTLLSDETKREAFAIAGRAWAISRYSDQVHLDGLESVYRSLKKPTKRIAVLANAFPPDYVGGAATIANVQVELLKSAGYDVRVWQSPCTWRHRSIPIRLWKHLLDLRAQLGLVHKITAWKPDVLITHNLTGCGFATPKRIQSNGIRWLHILHDVQLFDPSGTLSDAQPITLWQRTWSFLRCHALGRPDMTLSPTQWLLNEHKRRGFFQASPTDILPNPGPTATTSAEPPKAGEKLRILFLGQTKEKGLDLVRTLMTRHADIHWTLAADRPNGFTGKEVMDLMPTQHLLLVPSLIEENQPTVILEAASVGLPVIASDRGGIRETLQGQGSVVPTNQIEDWEKAIRALKEPIEWQRQSEKIKNIAARHDPAIYLHNLERHL